MSESLNNKELAAVGHEFAKELNSYTPIGIEKEHDILEVACLRVGIS